MTTREQAIADDMLTGYATKNVVPVSQAETRALIEMGEAVKRALVCPIRGCEGHEGPHGSLWVQR